MKRTRNRGFSLLEVIAASVILAVVAAAAVATVAPMRAKSDDRRADQEIATLNAMSQRYFDEKGSYARNANDLGTAGYLASTTPQEQAILSKIRRDYAYTRTTGVFAKK